MKHIKIAQTVMLAFNLLLGCKLSFFISNGRIKAPKNMQVRHIPATIAIPTFQP